MTPADRHQQFQAILARHDDIARAFERTRRDISAAQNGLEQVGRDIRDLTQAISEAAAGMLAANRAALALYQDTDEDPRA